MEENPKTPVLKPALIYGLIFGLVSIIISLLFYFVDLAFEMWAGLLSMLISIVVLAYLLLLYKKEYGKGFISYGRVVGMSTLIGLVAGILMLIFTTALYSADDAYLQDYKYNYIEKMDERLEKQDLKYQEKFNDEQYEMYEERVTAVRDKQMKKLSATTPVKLGIQSIWGIVFSNVIYSLIIGIFIKKKPDPFQG